MIGFTMAHKTISNSRKFAAFLAVTSMLYGGIAFAADYVSTTQPSYDKSQSLPQLSPEQIAADVLANFDPLTGRTEYIARDFDPFEDSSQMAGSASLRSAASGISRDGASISGGAYLDVSILYSSASRDPYDSKGYEHAVYLNGQPVNVMTYDVQTLDCTRDITKVTYDDGYYRGNSYGYVGGMYRLFPRYRGHSQYYNHFDRIRYGSWRGTRHHYYGHHGYDSRHGNYHAGGSRHDDQGRNGRNHDDRGNDHDRRDIQDRILDNEDRRDRDSRRGVLHSSPRVISTHNVIRPDMLGDRRLSGGTNLSDRPVKETYTRPIMQPIKVPPSRPTITRATPRSAIIRPDRPAERRLQASPARDIGTRHNIRRETVITPPRQVTRPVVRANTPAVSRPSASRPESRPRPTSSSSTPSRPTQSRPQPRTQTRAEPRQQSRPKPRPAPRAVDRAFKGKNKTSARPFRYFPGDYTQTATYVDSRCVKEERLSLHIPAERLDAARFDGLSLVLLDRAGQDVPVYIPPNYIEGFRRANPYLSQSYHQSVTPPVMQPPVVQPYGTYPQTGG